MAHIIWRMRYWLFRKLHTLAMWFLPPGRYKRELNAMLWTMNFRVQAHYVQQHPRAGEGS